MQVEKGAIILSLFDDDFFSTKVSKRLKRAVRSPKLPGRMRLPSPFRGKKLSSGQLIAVTSLASAVVAILLFVLLTGSMGKGKADLGPGSKDFSASAVAASTKMRPAVVSIINEQTAPAGAGRRSGKKESGKGILKEAGVGSGVIISKQGDKAFVVTNHHVIVDAERVKVVLTNGEVREATVVGSDLITDLAVLEISSKNIRVVAEIGDSSRLRAAEFVMAMGNPLGMGEAVTLGVVSVIKEIVPVSLSQNGIIDWEQEVIRVDAAINEGNSGGPLIDMYGKVVGINSMKIADFGVESIGYAIPINNAMPIIESLMKQGYVSRPYLGVYTIDLEQYWQQQEMQRMFEQELNKLEEEEESADDGTDGSDSETSAESESDTDLEGASDSEVNSDTDAKTDNKHGGSKLPDLQLPDEVFSGVIVVEAVGPAAQAGLMLNDIIVKLDNKKINSTRELRRYLYNEKQVGDSIQVSYYREGQLETVEFQLEDKQDEE